ncbi:MAG: ABC transporter permease subunit [Kiritimatiellae bacterium]|nr:ABC transporter permease subunit [Kiritimatiellia bacterium]
MRALGRIWQVALNEWAGAIRSRRALVLLLLYVVAAVMCMYGTISAFSRMEKELAQVLQLPAAEQTGVVSTTLWKSKPFKKIVRAVVQNDLVFKDIEGRHPIELVYAWFVFLCAPLLVVLVSGNRVADDLHSGAVRYSIVRCTRVEWTLGKYLGQALLLVCGLVASALAAWIVAEIRLSQARALLPAMFDWGTRAWVYSLAWLGVALGISHLSRTGSRATALGIFAVTVLGILPTLLSFFGTKFDLAWLSNFDCLSPSSVTTLLWRQSAEPLGEAAFRLVVLGLFYLLLGSAVFRRRDA